ncbi:GIY-YIG nuclease family protein [Paenibacillus sp. NRS-1775]|uniref:GIY-YIG nuclease family protein n=1 Tax=unclassified Paenibacillus TaxID=185978 RepID=UPI003D2C6137
MIVYKATNKVNNKKYIGQTVQTLEKRKSQHENDHNYNSSKHYPFSNAIAKYGKENFEWEIIDTATSIEELNDKESYWIKCYESSTEAGKGYNLRANGKNNFLSEEVKRKIGDAQKGELNHMYGITGSDHHNSKPVLNVTDNIDYVSLTQCAEIEGLSLRTICAVCLGQKGSYFGKIYRYLDKEGKIIENENFTQPRKIKRVINVDTGEIFNTITEAQISVGVKNRSGDLGSRLKAGNGSCCWKSQRWKYEKSNVDDDDIPRKNYRKDGKRIKNVTTGEIYPTIHSVGKGYRNLATAVRLGNGKCRWRKQEWELL